MAKNTGDYKFRKVDVDQYDTEKFDDHDEMTDEGNVQGPNESEVTSFLNKGNNLSALQAVLNNPPVTTKNQAVKDKAFQLVLRVLLAFKSSEIDGALKSLDAPTLDILMKYIYRGFEVPSEGSSAQLLTWHEKTFAVAGIGSIVRVLTDRKRV